MLSAWFRAFFLNDWKELFKNKTKLGNNFIYLKESWRKGKIIKLYAYFRRLGQFFELHIYNCNFSVMFTTENEIICRSWKQIYRLWKYDVCWSNTTLLYFLHLRSGNFILDHNFVYQESIKVHTFSWIIEWI